MLKKVEYAKGKASVDCWATHLLVQQHLGTKDFKQNLAEIWK